MNTWRLVLIAVVLCSVPGGVFLHQVCPTECSCDADGEVLCQWKNLTSVPDDLPDNMTILRLPFNSLTELGNRELSNKGCGNIVHLHLTFNDIAILETEAFWGLTSVRYINLAHNQITVFNKDIFSSNLMLKELHLGFNPLTMPSSDTVSLLNSASLNKLSLAHTKLTQVSTGWFNETPNITTLELEFNKLSSLDWLLSNHLENLNKLDLKFNALNHLECASPAALARTYLNTEQPGSPDPRGSPAEEPAEHTVRTVNLRDNTLTCDCCLSLTQFVLEQLGWTLDGNCSKADGSERDLSYREDESHVKQCYLTFLEGNNSLSVIQTLALNILKGHH